MIFDNKSYNLFMMKKILIIEDEDLVRQMLQSFLQHAGYESYVINNVKLDEIKSISKNYDVILCDFMMPDISGYDIYNALDTEDRKKVIISTGGYIDYEKEEFFKNHGVHILYKPFILKELLRLINEMCSEKLCKES